MLVMEHPLQYQYFLSAWMHMAVKDRVRRPPDQGSVNAIKLMQRHHMKARHHALIPRHLLGVDPNGLLIAWTELPQLHKQTTSRHRGRPMARARGMTQIRAGRIVTSLVGKDTFQNQDFLPAPVFVTGKV